MVMSWRWLTIGMETTVSCADAVRRPAAGPGVQVGRHDVLFPCDRLTRTVRVSVACTGRGDGGADGRNLQADSAPARSMAIPRVVPAGVQQFARRGDGASSCLHCAVGGECRVLG